MSVRGIVAGVRVWIAGALVAALLVAVLAGTGARASIGNARDRLIETVESWRAPSFAVPAGWPKPVYDFSGNPVTRAGFALGRRLFYDPQLSRDGSTSCASCHQQFAAFAHYDHPVSHGIRNQNGTRNAPGLFNLAWQPALMWDGSVHHLEVQPLAPISNPVEMDESIEHVVAKLSADDTYKKEFAAAFGSPGIDSQRLLKAMTQFVGTMVSAGSRYDRYTRGEPDALTATERDGLALFRARCANCHAEPLLTDFSYRNNGLDAAPRDRGRETVTAKEGDFARFRVPSLRNVALTPPYMHDGRHDTLEQVVDHYADTVQPSPTLDPQLAGGVTLDAAQRAALVAFLKSLSDERFVHDRRYAEARR